LTLPCVVSEPVTDGQNKVKLSSRGKSPRMTRPKVARRFERALCSSCSIHSPASRIRRRDFLRRTRRVSLCSHGHKVLVIQHVSPVKEHFA
jgi:hypothetical protein